MSYRRTLSFYAYFAQNNPMDMVAALRYVFDHNQQVIAGLVVVILVTAILLFIRAIREGNVDSAKPRAAATPSAVQLDIGAIEAALKKVMASAGQLPDSANVSAPTRSASSFGTAADSEGTGKEERVQNLAREIDRLTAELASKNDGPGFGGTAASTIDATKLKNLQEKIDELQSRLSEYEIIEDDIADLSKYKDENAELRSELEALRKNAVAASSAPLAARPTPTPAGNSASTAQAVTKLAPFKDSTPLDDDQSAGVGVDGELAMKEFASSIQVLNSAGGSTDGTSVLDDTLDTEKMLSEIAGLQDGLTDDGEDVLTASLDTDRLMSEVDSLAPQAAASAPAAAPPAAAVVSTVPAQPVFEDDLLAEFKDSNDGGQG